MWNMSSRCPDWSSDWGLNWQHPWETPEWLLSKRESVWAWVRLSHRPVLTGSGAGRHHHCNQLHSKLTTKLWQPLPALSNFLRELPKVSVLPFLLLHDRSQHSDVASRWSCLGCWHGAFQRLWTLVEKNYLILNWFFSPFVAKVTGSDVWLCWQSVGCQYVLLDNKWKMT